MRVGTLRQTPCVACATQLSQKPTAGMTYNCQTMRSCHASAAGTKSYAREVIIVYSIRAKLIVLFATILTLTKDIKRLKTGGPVLLRWIIF